MSTKNEHHGLLYVVLMLGFALIVFAPVLDSSVCLFTTDNNIGEMARVREYFPGSLISHWDHASLLGSPNGFAPWNVTTVLCGLLTPRQCVNWIHGIEVLLGALFLWGLFRAMNIRLLASSVLGGVTAYWVGTNFTLIYSGHIAKFVVVMCVPLVLCMIIYALKNTRGMLWAALAGGVIALMLSEQQDGAIFFGFMIGSYAVFRIIRLDLIRGYKGVAVIAVIIAVALLIAGPTLVKSYMTNIKGVASVSDEDPQAKWDFITQWSQPPDETIEFLAPGYMGWRSGEPDGPYWGRSGRSAGWEQTKQGFMNFRLDGLYIGAIPIAFALFALVSALALKRSAAIGEDLDWRDKRVEILFWGAVAIIALLLAYGKFTPLYWLFYQLPLVNNIRAPVKFLQVFQVALAILAAYGLDLALRSATDRKTMNP